VKECAVRSFKEFKAEREREGLPLLDEIFITEDGVTYQQLDEGRKWVSGRFERNIGIDQPTSGAGQRHAHVYGRKGNELVVVNVDGTGSHGSKGVLHVKDAEALILQGFTPRKDRIVEWTVVGEMPQLLLG
jgi:hypothetical protein